MLNLYALERERFNLFLWHQNLKFSNSNSYIWVISTGLPDGFHFLIPNANQAPSSTR